MRLSFRIAGQTIDADPSQGPSAGLDLVTPEFFQTFGIRILNGRAFSERDTASSVKVAVVNQDFADKYLNGADPLRQQVIAPWPRPDIAGEGAPVSWQIVGVIHDQALRVITSEFLQ